MNNKRLSLVSLILSVLMLNGCGHPSAVDNPAAVGDLSAAGDAAPTYHRLPMSLAEPADVDADGSGTSAALTAKRSSPTCL